MNGYRKPPAPEAPIDPHLSVLKSSGLTFLSGNRYSEPEWMKDVCTIGMTPAEYEAAERTYRKPSLDESLKNRG